MNRQVTLPTAVLHGLAELDLIERLLKTGHHFSTTSVAMHNVNLPRELCTGAYDAVEMLYVETFSGDKSLNVFELRKSHTLLTIYECSVLVHARQIGAALITSEGSLIKAAGQMEIETLDFTWVFYEMMAHSLITTPQACEAACRLQVMFNSSGRISNEMKHFLNANRYNKRKCLIQVA